MSLYIALAVPVLVYWFRQAILRLLTPLGIPDVPAYPDPRPIWGDIHRFQKSMKTHGGFSRCFDEMAAELGVLSQIRLGFFKTFIVLADLPTIEHVLTKQTGVIDRAAQTTDIFAGLAPTGQIALPTNEMWKHHRRIVGPAMTSKYLSLTTPLANEAVSDLIEYFKVKIERAEGRAWSVAEDMEGATLDAICAMAFGSSWGVSQSYRQQVGKGTIESGDLGQALFPVKSPKLHESMLYLFNSIDNFAAFPRVSNFITSLKPTYRKHQRVINDYLKAKAEDARKRAREIGAEAAAETATNTLDMMVARELKGEDWMSEEEMRDELYIYLIAGTETSATTLSWWAKYMTTHPDVQRKLRAHIIERVPEIQDRPPTFEELNAANTPYLEAVVHESLRMSRTAGGYAREAKEDVVILGKRIPKGTTIIMPTVTGLEDETNPVYAVEGTIAQDSRVRSAALDPLRASARKTGYWKAGTGREFMPERWLDEEGRFDINAGPSLPFSIGQRACFGKNLALLELRLFMVQLNQAFFFAPVAEDQNSFDNYETITSHPRQSFVRPVLWSD